MSQDILDPELFADFIIEAKEHLETIEPNLLELEKVPDNVALLNEIFRPMHSLKGASGFLYLNRINHLAHKAENILDELRKGAMVVTPEIMDVILASTDALRQMIDNLETTTVEGDVAIEPIIEAIDAIMRGDRHAPVATGHTLAPQGADAPQPTAPAVDLSMDALEAAFLEAQREAMEEIAPAPAPAPSVPPVAAPAPIAISNRVLRTILQPKEWIESQARKPEAALTAFGEAHLKDFIDEARENTENLTSGLLDLERNPEGNTELVNDLFRYFHNLKGNSGIIDYQELNGLTHEAETLLNRVRHEELAVTHELVDLLLFVVDALDALVDSINPSAGSATPYDCDPLLVQLKQAVAGGAIALPPAYLACLMPDEPESNLEPVDRLDVILSTETAQSPDQAEFLETAASSAPEQDQEVAAAAVMEAQANLPLPPPVPTPPAAPLQAAGADRDEDDLDMFQTTVRQQQSIMDIALQKLAADASQKEQADALFRCLTAIQKAASFMKFEDVRVYAERTAGLVDQARQSDIDFGIMLSILEQEVAIIGDMINKVLQRPEISPENSAENSPASPAASLTSPSDAAPAGSVTPVTSANATPANAAPAPAPAPAESSAPAGPADFSVPMAQAVTSPVAQATLKPAEQVPVKASAPSPIPSPAAPKAAAAASAPVQTASSVSKPVESKPAAARSSAASPIAATADTNTTPKSSSTIRVDHEKLDHLMNLIGELIINRNRYSMIGRQLEEGGESIKIDEVAQQLAETTYAMARISNDLQDTIMKVRMVPVASVFSRFPRLVRDLSRKSGKEVDLILEGEETELDKSVVEVIGDPLVHLIRNSVDHGIESEAERLAVGKPAKGRVVLRAYHKGNSVAIEIEDDGKGIDPEKMREVAVRKGVITAEEARNLDDREAIDLIFAPGFSSADKVTDISGRGVGMDVVRTNIKNLKGSVNTTSEVGKGTRFTLSLPLTLAIIDALMITVSNQIFAIPLDAVSATTKLESDMLTDIKGRKAVTMRGEVLGIVQLAELLNLPRSEELPKELSVVIIQDNDRRMGLVVDRLLERQEVVIKPLGAYLGDLRGISGATILGDGSVILILDPHDVYMMATSKAI